MKFTFWLCAALIIYTYVGYPLWLALLKLIKTRPISKNSYEPFVSVVIAACNEEQIIARRVRNVLEQDYPPHKVEVIVVSDCSSDGTVAAVQALHEQRVKVLDLSLRYGKAVAVNSGVAIASGEIIVFTDSRQTFEPGVIRQLAANFADASVGCVSGELLFLQSETSTIQAEMGAYWKYEKWIRKAESATGSVIGATGCIYAIRRHLYQKLPPWTLLDDVLTPMNIVLQGFRTVFDSTAVAYDVVSKDVAQEWKRKVRTLAGNWQLISLASRLLLPWSNPCWWRFIAHKMLRIVVPFALLLLLLSGALIEGTLYRVATGIQGGFYAMALMGFLLPATRINKLVNLCYFFLMMNAGAVAGFWRWAMGRCTTSWQPAYGNGSK